MTGNQQTAAGELDFDAIIVGAGFAGLYMLHKLRSAGLTARVFETGDGVGGTWYWNRYPGARCDVPSMEYSYQFDPQLQQDWEWTERFSSQAEILKYLEHVADRFDLLPDIQFNTRVDAAEYDDAADVWVVETDTGASLKARFLIMATGCLSARYTPNIEGLDDFEGVLCHTGKWPKEGVNVAGKRVGVIGTGSSGIQVSPMLAKDAEQLFVFQRSPAYSVPSHNGPLDPEEQMAIKSRYAEFRAEAKRNRAGIMYVLGENSALDADEEELRREYDKTWAVGGLGFTAAFKDIFDDVDANNTAAEFVREKIRSIVRDPELAEALSPHTLIGCKRLCVDADYFDTFNRANVTLVDLRKGAIDQVTKSGVVVGGEEIPLDVIVLATGFDAITGALLRVNIRGKGGIELKQKWADGPKTYLGHSISGFPNLFAITGPGSPSVLSNLVPSIEQDVDWIGDCIFYMREHGHQVIEATPEAEAGWVAHVNEVAHNTIYPLEDSWYVGTNIPGKPRVFLPYIGFPDYVARCNEAAEQGYVGYELG
jgi:cyclohexanone monooxygenase